jgi:non-canonical (house-cleaning) NTP pyrophosphatase
MKRKVLVLSTGFSGHLFPVREFINRHKNEVEFCLIVVGWQSVHWDRATIEIDRVHSVNSGNLAETGPENWTFERAKHTLARCIEIAKDFGPDLIVDEFFAIEGYFLAKLLKIERWCLIPAKMGRYDGLAQQFVKRALKNPINVNALAEIQRVYGIRISSRVITGASDVLFIQGDLNLVCSFPGFTRPDFLKGRPKSRYVFIGSMMGEKFINNFQPVEKEKVLLILGTVLLGNIWEQNKVVREQIRAFVQQLATLWDGAPFEVIFVTQGKMVLQKYPINWQHPPTIDVPQTLTTVKVVVGHGGSGITHEALVNGKPVAILPAFGDQLDTAIACEQAGIGINLAPEAGIDTHGITTFDDPHALARRVDSAVRRMLREGSFVKAYLNLNRQAARIGALLNKKIDLQPGEVLVGTKAHVDAYHNSFPHDNLMNINTYINPLGGSSLSQNFYLMLPADDSAFISRFLPAFEYLLAGANGLDERVTRAINFFGQLYRVHILDGGNFPQTKIHRYFTAHPELYAETVILYNRYRDQWIPSLYGLRGYLKKTRVRSITANPYTRIFSASVTNVKLVSMINGLSRRYKLSHYSIVATDCSMVADAQLVGMENIIGAAVKRMQMLIKQNDNAKPENNELYVSIVSGVLENHGNVENVTVIYLKSGRHEVIAKSATYLFPKDVADLTQSFGYDQHTIGGFLAKMVGQEYVGTNPIKYLSGGKISQDEIIEEGFVKALDLLDYYN